VSHQEGFSNSVLEGMAAGLPMIVTDVGGNSEAVIDGDCGLVVPSGNPSRLAHAIMTLMNDREMSIAYGRAARARVDQVFSMDKCVYEYQQLLERIPVQ
jgi:glycosyltransferase involved in cell wall biosynthesis